MNNVDESIKGTKAGGSMTSGKRGVNNTIIGWVNVAGGIQIFFIISEEFYQAHKTFSGSHNSKRCNRTV